MKAYDVPVGEVYRFSDKMLEEHPYLYKGTYTRTPEGSVRDDGCVLIFRRFYDGHVIFDVTIVSEMEVCV